ncbi:hypothetical protein [Bacteroides heparinolyticus]|uniref:hypothetical protein n=1 Tax=Prevotella heparinolytica TaxID=28113 RepID=UPI003FA02951
MSVKTPNSHRPDSCSEGTLRPAEAVPPAYGTPLRKPLAINTRMKKSAGGTAL